HNALRPTAPDTAGPPVQTAGKSPPVPLRNPTPRRGLPQTETQLAGCHRQTREHRPVPPGDECTAALPNRRGGNSSPAHQTARPVTATLRRPAHSAQRSTHNPDCDRPAPRLGYSADLCWASVPPDD